MADEHLLPVFALPVDWSDAPIERYAFRTNVLTSQNESEQLRGTISVGTVRSTRSAGDAYVNAYGLEGNERLTQWHIGMYYLPIKNVELGTELMGGRRTTFGGDTGSLSRLNLQARYIFN